MLDARQRVVAERVRAGAAGAILFSEVAPVITAGSRTPEADFIASGDELRGRGVDLYHTDRGGLATYHGPGMWLVFAVDSLERMTGDRRGVRAAVEGLLACAVMVCREFGVDAWPGEGARSGLWCPGGKLASLGIRIEKGIVLHGFALNVFRTPGSFYGIRPCGMEASAIAYLAEQCRFDAGFDALPGMIATGLKNRFWVAPGPE